MAILVTGASGFAGTHIVRALRDRGQHVIAIDNQPASSVIQGVEYHTADIRDQRAIEKLTRRAESVIHNASIVHTKNNLQDVVWEINQKGTANLLTAAQQSQVERFVYISSGSVVYDGKHIEYGNETLPYSSTSQAPYIDSKAAAEKLVLENNGVGGMATCALRPHVIYGPGDQRFMPSLLKQAESGRLQVQVGLGNYLTDFTYIDNFIDAIQLAETSLAKSGLQSKTAGQAYFVTDGIPMPFWDFIRKIVERLELPKVKYRVPGSLVYAIATIKEAMDTLRGGSLGQEDGLSKFAVRFLCTHHYFDITKAQVELGYKPGIEVDEGIERTCQFLEESGALSYRASSASE